MLKLIKDNHGELWCGDTLEIYQDWDRPTIIISDGPYGIDGYVGDAKKPEGLKEMYEPHVKAWSKAATSETTLWLWNTEVGWASVHQLLIDNGWLYRGCNIWDKGIDHIAGNCNGKTMRKFPVVTEVCAHYVRKESFSINSEEEISVQQWVRAEWERTGIPIMRANDACGVKNAASRKYLTKDHLWYFPPKEEFQKLVQYANKYGKSEGLPYFSIDGKSSLSEKQWERMRAKFNFEYGVTNVWKCPPLRSKERLKDGTIITHPNQKPKELMKRIIMASSDEGDVVWEPFGGMATASIVAKYEKRIFFVCEINPTYANIAKKRLLEK
jgi:site-specific DNA-methyltransferase (adenine-specific)